MHRLYDYLTPTLTPDDTLLGEVATAEWWLYVKPEFDNIIWQYYEDRTIFMNHKFPVMDAETTYSNLLRTFAINLRSKARQFERLYNVIMKDYEPLWNLDSVQGVVYQDEHTGTDTTAKTGTDTSTLSGTDTIASTGNDVLAHSGSDIDRITGTDSHAHNVTKDTNTKTGNETIEVSGNDSNTKKTAAFDTASLQNPYLPNEQDTVAHGKKDTHTYNNLKDAHELTESTSDTYGKVDTMQHGHVETTTHGKTDTTRYGRSDQMTHNTLDTLTKNLTDKHMELIMRQGNQGVTKSQEMLLDEINAWSNELTNFIKYVVRDCVNQCTYAVEGV